MGNLNTVTAWLWSQPPLSFLLVGVALHSSAVGLALLWQSVSEGLPALCPHRSRRARGRILLKELAKALGG